MKKQIPIILILLVVVAYSNTLKHDFLNFDDNKYITNSKFTKEFCLKNIITIFAPTSKHINKDIWKIYPETKCPGPQFP